MNSDESIGESRPPEVAESAPGTAERGRTAPRARRRKLWSINRWRVRKRVIERQRLGYALLVSLVVHMFLLLLQIDDPGLGLPGADVAAEAARSRPPDVSIVLLPAPAPASSPTATPANPAVPAVVPLEALAPGAANPVPNQTVVAAANPSIVSPPVASQLPVQRATPATAAPEKPTAKPQARTNAPDKVATARVASRPRQPPAAVAPHVPKPVPRAPSVKHPPPSDDAVLAVKDPSQDKIPLPPPRPVKAPDVRASSPETADLEEELLAQKQREEQAKRVAAEKEAAALESQRQEAARVLAEKAELARQEAAKQEAAKQEAARQEAARQEAARQEEARQEAARQEAARAAAAR